MPVLKSFLQLGWRWKLVKFSCSHIKGAPSLAKNGYGGSDKLEEGLKREN